MTFRRTPFTPYDTTGWGIQSRVGDSDEMPEEVYRHGPVVEPEAGVPLRRPTETDLDYQARMSYEEYLRDDDLAQKVDEMASCICIDVDVDPTCPSHGVPEEDPIGDTSPAGYDAHDFARDK